MAFNMSIECWIDYKALRALSLSLIAGTKAFQLIREKLRTAKKSMRIVFFLLFGFPFVPRWRCIIQAEKYSSICYAYLRSTRYGSISNPHIVWCLICVLIKYSLSYHSTDAESNCDAHSHATISKRHQEGGREEARRQPMNGC